MADTFSFPADRYILIGKIGKPHGLRGEVRMSLYSGQPENLQSYSHLVLVATDGSVTAPLRIVSSRAQGKGAVVGFESILDRDGAEKLAGMGVILDRAEIAGADKGDSFWFQFIGLAVKTEDGRYLGRVEHIFSNGAQDILVIRDGSAEYLVPILDSIITCRTDEEIVVAPPPGLLELNSGIADGGDD
ncbi:MAG: ribosome maturation factor RimM [Desulfocapsaceae bacterium]|nr:ribosome maturation factor RimM [Desulfocapsaceae bacterium]